VKVFGPRLMRAGAAATDSLALFNSQPSRLRPQLFHTLRHPSSGLGPSVSVLPPDGMGMHAYLGPWSADAPSWRVLDSWRCWWCRYGELIERLQNSPL
jgi:hypothetical protein